MSPSQGSPISRTPPEYRIAPALRGLRSETELYPEIVADLTDYAIFDHGALLDLLLEEDGQAIAAELNRKARTEIACLHEHMAICQPNLAERNEVILSALSYFEEETRGR